MAKSQELVPRVSIKVSWNNPVEYVNALKQLWEQYGKYCIDHFSLCLTYTVGCKVTKYSYEKYNCEHVAHLIKHGRLERIIENDLKKLYEESNPDNPKINILKDNCTHNIRGYSSEIFIWTRKIGNGGSQHPKTIVSRNTKLLEHFYELAPGNGENPPILKISNYPELVLHFLESYMNMEHNQLLNSALKVIKTPPVSKESHIQGLLTKMESLWCAEAIKIAPPKTPGQLFQCGKNKTHFNINALVLHDIVKIAKLALKDFLDFIKPMIDGDHDYEWLEKQRKTNDNPMLYMKAADWMGPDHLYEAFEGKRCVEEKFLDKLWRSVEIESAPPRPYEIKIVHFDFHETK